MKKILMFAGGCCVIPFVLVVIIVILAILAPQRKYSEENLQNRFDHIVEQNQRTNHLNPVESITIDLHDDYADFEMTWEDGQMLTSKVVVAEDGKTFDLQDVNVTGTADVLDELAENISEEVVESVFEEFLKSQPKDVQSIDIDEEELILFFK